MIRKLNPQLDFAKLCSIYQRAFAGFPWFEKLKDIEVKRRLAEHFSKPGFQGFVADTEGLIAGAIWWDTPTIGILEQERGKLLADFCRTQPYDSLVWEREVVVDHAYQGKGIASRLREAFTLHLQQQSIITFVTTRMRNDNIGIIKIAEKLNFKRTGVQIPSSQGNNLYHEYWYLTLGGQ